MTRLSQLIGQSTISLADAEKGGNVQGVQVDNGRVTGLRTRDGLIDMTAIRTLEGDAVTFDGQATAIDGPADSPLGRRVLTVDGDELGHLADIDISDDGTVTSVILEDGHGIEGSALKVIGSYAVIVNSGPTTAAPGAALPPPPADATPA